MEVRTQNECNESEREGSGNDITKIEVGIQTNELPCTCKYGCDLIKGNDTAPNFLLVFLLGVCTS